jgi:hypothetical protein
MILYYFPDTLGLPLEEINAIFEDEVSFKVTKFTVFGELTVEQYRDSIVGIEEGNVKGSFSDKSPKEVGSSE